jgi:alkylation response protein AidB-like acyl-CoA dehydrogenase
MTDKLRPVKRPSNWRYAGEVEMVDVLSTVKATETTHKQVEKFDVAEFRRRVAALAPKVRERAAEAETLGRLHQETFSELRDAKLLRIAQPVPFGGVGLDMDQVYELSFTLAQADPSTGWNAGFYALHNHQIGMMPLETQEEYWANSFDVQMATASGIAAPPVYEDKGDVVHVEGMWDYASGVDYADWIQISRLTEKGAQQLLIPRSDFEVIDNWQVFGTKATGSKRVKVKSAVPPHRQIDAKKLSEGETIGRELYPSPYYKLPIFPWMAYVIASPIMGATQGLVDMFAEQAVPRFEMTTGQKFIDRAANQLRLAEAAVHAARQVHAGDVRQFHEWANADYKPTLLERAAVRRNTAYCVKLCLNAAYTVFELGGAGSLYDRNPIQRYYRDISAASHSIAIVWDAIAEQYSRIRWNLEPTSYNL